MAVDLAGVLFLDQQKEGSQHKNPKTEMGLLIHATIRAHLIPSEIDVSIFGGEEDRNDHIDALPFTISGQNTPVDSWNAYLTTVGVVDWEEKLLLNISKDDEDLIANIGLNVFERMKSLPTTL